MVDYISDFPWIFFGVEPPELSEVTKKRYKYFGAY